MAPPLRARSRFPHSQSLPPEASYPYLSENRHNENDNHRKLIKLITWITACLTQWNYEPCLVGLPKIDGPWWRVLTKCGPLEKGMANHFNILALKTPWTVWKGKKIRHWEWTTQVSRCPICYWRRVEKWLQKEWRSWAKAKTMPSFGCDWWRK